MGPDSFARRSGLNREKAEKFIAEYFSNFARVKIWQEEVIRKTKMLGYVENLNGRRRYLPNINAPERFARAAAERAAVNMPIQSLAADILKLAMIRISEVITKKREDGIRLLLSIHDELLFEISDDILKRTAQKIRELMENIYPLKVPLLIELKKGKNWGNMEKIKL
jgi:DNA polymerase-1